MKEGFALRMENFIPRTDGLHLRQGSQPHVTGLGGAIQTLIQGPNKLFAATPTSIFDVTTAMSTPVAGVTGMTSGKWTSGVISNPGGAILVAANEANDPVKAYVGSAWMTAAITGVDATKLVACCVHQNRAFFIERGTLRVWYLDFMAFQGAARKLDLTPFVRKGGELVSIGSLTTDGGRNINDRLFVVTSNGEMIVYAGSNPAQSQTWQLGGVFEVPKPLGRNCFARNGIDLVYLSDMGLQPLPQLLMRREDDYKPLAFSDQIRDRYLSDVSATTTVFNNWSVHQAKGDAFLIINVPRSTGTFQYIYEPETRGWVPITGFNATCWQVLGNDLYFGRADGSVHKYGGSVESDGSAIDGYFIDALSRFGNQSKKRFTRAKPIFRSGGPYRIGILTEDMTVPNIFLSSRTRDNTSLWLWPEITWDITPASWTKSAQNKKIEWVSIDGRGHWGGLMIGVKSKIPTVYQGCEIMFETGGIT